MNICFICSEYPPTSHGGIGTSTQRLSRALVRAGDTVRVVGIYPPSCTEPEQENDQGVQVWRVKRSTARMQWIFARQHLYQIIAEWSKHGEIDLVELPDWQGWAAVWPQLPVPVIVRLRGSSTYIASETNQKIDRLGRWLERRSLQRADFWCAVSYYVASKTAELFSPIRPCSQVLYNSIANLVDLNPSARESNRVVFVGTLNVIKGVVQLIQAWPKVLAAIPSGQLHFYGKDGKTAHGGSMQAYLNKQLDPKIRSSVVFHGRVDHADLQQVYQQATVTVVPSLVESFPNVPLEAMAGGSPVIFTKHGPGPELIQHGVNGWLIDPENVDEIAQTIIAVLQDKCIAERIGQAGRQLVQTKFNLDKIVIHNRRFYQDCIKNFANNLH